MFTGFVGKIEMPLPFFCIWTFDISSTSSGTIKATKQITSHKTLGGADLSWAWGVLACSVVAFDVVFGCMAVHSQNCSSVT